jgi:hypothetical protein
MLDGVDAIDRATLAWQHQRPDLDIPGLLR